MDREVGHAALVSAQVLLTLPVVNAHDGNATVLRAGEQVVAAVKLQTRDGAWWERKGSQKPSDKRWCHTADTRNSECPNVTATMPGQRKHVVSGAENYICDFNGNEVGEMHITRVHRNTFLIGLL